jgi:transcription termination factor Rho
MPKLHMLRRFLSGLNVEDEMPQLLRALEKFKNNDEFLSQLDIKSY